MQIDIEKWGKENIIWVGNEHTNKSYRRRYLPELIVNHITEGTAQSCIDWFTSAGNKVSSAHFLVAKNGKVYQFVRIEDNAWANGLSEVDAKKSNVDIIRNRGVNPNWYSVSIEHEGIFAETKGELTKPQLKSTINLHKYIIHYVNENFGTDIKADVDHILGHNQIDPKRKPNCPGEKFPLVEIIKSIEYQEISDVNLAVNILYNHGIINSPEYWSKAKDVIKYQEQLYINMANYIISKQ